MRELPKLHYSDIQMFSQPVSRYRNLVLLQVKPARSSAQQGVDQHVSLDRVAKGHPVDSQANMPLQIYLDESPNVIDFAIPVTNVSKRAERVCANMEVPRSAMRHCLDQKLSAMLALEIERIHLVERRCQH